MRTARAIVDTTSLSLEITSKASPDIKRLIILFSESRHIDIDNPNDNDLLLIYSNASLIRGFSPKMPTLKPTEHKDFNLILEIFFSGFTSTVEN